MASNLIPGLVNDVVVRILCYLGVDTKGGQVNLDLPEQFVTLMRLRLVHCAFYGLLVEFPKLAALSIVPERPFDRAPWHAYPILLHMAVCQGLKAPDLFSNPHFTRAPTAVHPQLPTAADLTQWHKTWLYSEAADANARARVLYSAAIVSRRVDVLHQVMTAWSLFDYTSYNGTLTASSGKSFRSLLQQHAFEHNIPELIIFAYIGTNLRAHYVIEMFNLFLYKLRQNEVSGGVWDLYKELLEEPLLNRMFSLDCMRAFYKYITKEYRTYAPVKPNGWESEPKTLITQTDRLRLCQSYFKRTADQAELDAFTESWNAPKKSVRPDDDADTVEPPPLKRQRVIVDVSSDDEAEADV